MPKNIYFSTRKDFFKQVAGLALSSSLARASDAGPKLLIVVAHPDDEYMFAATTYRLVRELGWTADQVVITNGEAGYRYAALAELVYGTKLTQENLPSIRREEVLRAGKLLGIRRHYFLDQRDLGFTSFAARADTSNWDRARISQFLSELLAKERYDAIFTLLPSMETHGHHRAATLLALEAVDGLEESARPLVFGADAEEGLRTFEGSDPFTATVQREPSIMFDRNWSFGYRNALNYQIVVNWVIAEHKSRGMFQNDAGKNRFERFWLFRVSGRESRCEGLREQLLKNTNHFTR
jgi:LmbE family N-acetylglucosaminyl deacetylase